MSRSHIEIDQLITDSAGCEDAEVSEEEGDEGGRGVVHQGRSRPLLVTGRVQILVRKVLLVYKNVDDGPDYKPGGYKDMTTERSIHNLVLIQPINDREDVKKTSPTGNTT